MMKRKASLLASVIVCTARRADLLHNCLQSLVQQTLSPDKYEVIVVDNAPLEDRHQVADIVVSLQGRASVRYVAEPEPGLSFARNRGAKESRGRIVAFVDDDATAEPTWLEQLLKVYREHPDAAIVGGRVVLELEEEAPAWLTPQLRRYLSELDQGEGVKIVQPPLELVGCNFSVRRDVLDALGGFSTQLGRIGSALLSGEETELVERVQQSGGTCYYAGEAVVRHIVPRARLRESFFRRRAYWQGVSRAEVEFSDLPWTGLPFRMITCGLRPVYQGLRIATYRLSRNPERAMRWEVYMWENLGYLIGIVSKKLQHLLNPA